MLQTDLQLAFCIKPNLYNKRQRIRRALKLKRTLIPTSYSKKIAILSFNTYAIFKRNNKNSKATHKPFTPCPKFLVSFENINK